MQELHDCSNSPRGTSAADAVAEHVLDNAGNIVKSTGPAADFPKLAAAGRVHVSIDLLTPDGTRLYTLFRWLHAALSERGIRLECARLTAGATTLSSEGPDEQPGGVDDFGMPLAEVFEMYVFHREQIELRKRGILGHDAVMREALRRQAEHRANLNAIRAARGEDAQ